MILKKFTQITLLLLIGYFVLNCDEQFVKGMKDNPSARMYFILVMFMATYNIVAAWITYHIIYKVSTFLKDK